MPMTYRGRGAHTGDGEGAVLLGDAHSADDVHLQSSLISTSNRRHDVIVDGVDDDDAGVVQSVEVGGCVLVGLKGGRLA